MNFASFFFFTDRLLQPANGAQSPVREEFYNTRIAHRVSLRNFKFDDMCVSSGAVTIHTSRETESCAKKLFVQS